MDTQIKAWAFDAYGTLFDPLPVQKKAGKLYPAAARPSAAYGAPANSSTPGCDL